MAMTAHAYQDLYRNLKVPIVNEQGDLSGWQPVDVHKYLLAQEDTKAAEAGKPKPPEHYNIQKSSHPLGELESKLIEYFKKPGATLKVFVATAEVDERSFTAFKDVWYYARKPFWGKGSPEEVQIALQLVLRFKLATPAGLQAYCDEASDGLAQGRIGLDCNGFVGNFLDHGFRGKAWDSDKIGFSDYQANVGIKDTMDKLGPEVKELSDIQMLETYVMGLAHPNTMQVINRTSADHHTGHIVVTTPFTTVVARPFMYALLPVIKMRVVESTLDAGLTESDYYLLSGEKNVFKVWRGSKAGTAYETMNVRIRPAR